MIRILLRFAMLPIMATLLAVMPVAAQQYPAEPGNGVADLAGIIEAADADSLRATVAALRTEAGVEVRVLTVQNIAGYGTADPTPEAFATAVYNDWKLGYGQRQDGVLVMVSVDDRFARIELGDQVPAHQDAVMQSIMYNEMVPHFRAGDYNAGIMAGMGAIARSFRDPDGVMSPRLNEAYSDPQTAYDEPSTGTDSTSTVTFVIVAAVGLLLLLTAGAGGAQHARSRKRNCAHCGRRMQLLDETADNVHLDSGRRLEEVLGSVDYDVWQCTGCSHHQVLPYPRRFSPKLKCPGCGYKTVIVETTVLEPATYDSSGRHRVRKDCRLCSWHDEDVVNVPQRTHSTRRSSNSGSSGSSLFGFGGSPWGRGGGGSSRGRSSGGGGGGGGGGGSSSGRGASGRW